MVPINNPRRRQPATAVRAVDGVSSLPNFGVGLGGYIDAAFRGRQWVNNGATLRSGPEAFSASFVAASNQYISSSDRPLNPSAGMTVLALIKPSSSAPAATRGFFGIGNPSDSNSIFYAFQFTNGHLGMQMRGAGGGTHIVTSSKQMLAGGWYLVAAWTDGANNGGVRIGGASFTNASAVGAFTAPATMAIGGLYRAAVAAPWDGEIAQVAVFPGVLQAADIDAALANLWALFAPVPRKILVGAAAGSGITVTSASVESPDTATSSLAATAGLTSASVESPDAAAAAAAASVDVQAALQEGADQAAAQIGPAVDIVAALAEAPDTAAGAVAPTVTLSAVLLDTPDAADASAAVAVAIASASTEAPDTLAAQITAPQVDLAAAAIEAPDALDAAVQASVDLQAQAQERADIAQASAQIAVDVSAVLRELLDTLSAQAQAELALAAAITEAPDRAAGAIATGTTLTAQQAEWIEGLARRVGLIDPLTVTATSAQDGSLSDGVLVQQLVAGVLTTTAAPSGTATATALALLEALARRNALVAPLTDTGTRLTDGTLDIAVAEAGSAATYTRLA